MSGCLLAFIFARAADEQPGDRGRRDAVAAGRRWTLRQSRLCMPLGLGLAVLLCGCPAKAPPNPQLEAMVQALSGLQRQPASRGANAAANAALASLLQDHSRIGDEALALLAGYYLGESTEPECEILRRGPRMLPLLAAADARNLVIPLRRSSVHSRAALAAWIRPGRQCDA